MRLNEKIKKLRKEKKLTLDELAKATESGKSYMWGIENKETKPSGEKLSKIAKVLDVTVDYLIDDKQEEPDEAVLRESFLKKYN